jgi:hypothetical protein
VSYVVLRRIGTAWSVSVLLGAALASERLNVIYSGRVKSYVIDALIVLGFAVVLPRLVRVRFSWRAAALWVVGSSAVGFFSPFALIASAVAGMILLVRASGDRAVRAAAVVGQGVLLAVVTAAVRRTYDVKALETWWKRNYDGFIRLDGQPLRDVVHIETHMRRVAGVFSGGPIWWASLTLIVVMVTLGVDAIVRRGSSRAVRAQYLLVLMLVAVVANMVGALPFGPTSIGMRLSLWLVPVFVIGGASALNRLRAALARQGVARIAFDATAVVVALVLIVGAAVGGPPKHSSDMTSAASFLESRLTTNDVVFINRTSGAFSYAVTSHADVHVRPRHSLVAFEPDFRDPRFHYFVLGGKRRNKVILPTESSGDASNVARVIGRADRVYIYVQVVPNPQRRGRFAFAIVLHTLGYRQESDTRFKFARVVVWRRSVS